MAIAVGMEDYLTMDRDDEMAEVDTTPDEFERMWADSEPAEFVEVPRHWAVFVSYSSDVVFANNQVQEPRPLYSGIDTAEMIA
ncbi:hypothetical protein C6A86_010180 [Mycobacterium sp. ITM-2016-00316]|uniref:hypothetical protein n=1 Tax=Mycobacterium sp. ITM-2016-00316 TaxID=2099695 RepID=UPI00115BC2A3|nr:hypothetical protein [Mycobacterium sp. ITM-2016-00316]WNG83973.1 hypothetical protein C6A86_010180 [Mycobacterium sp. ITM-2016-00316]